MQRRINDRFHAIGLCVASALGGLACGDGALQVPGPVETGGLAQRGPSEAVVPGAVDAVDDVAAPGAVDASEPSAPPERERDASDDEKGPTDGGAELPPSVDAPLETTEDEQGDDEDDEPGDDKEDDECQSEEDPEDDPSDDDASEDDPSDDELWDDEEEDGSDDDPSDDEDAPADDEPGPGGSGDDPDVTPPRTSFHLVVIGSSTAAGFGASRDGLAWTDLLHERLASVTPATVTLTNLAVAGYAAEDLLPGSGYRGNVDEALALAPQLLVVGIGGSNDLSGEMTTERFLSELEQVRDAADAAGVPTFFMGTLPKNLAPWDRELLGEWSQRMDERFRTCRLPGAPAAHDGCFIGVFDALADSSLGLASEYDSGDGHPNDAGHALLYQRSVGVIEPYVCATVECRSSTPAD